MRIQQNFLGGQLDSELSASGLTITSSALISAPVIPSGDYLPIILDPDGVYGSPEITYITDHGLGDSTATLVDDEAATPARVGKEGTTARIHPVDTFWIHGPTAADFAAQNRIDLPKIYDDAEDEDFSSGLVASWTVTSGVVGTVDLLGTSPGIYDTSTHPGRLLTQTDSSTPVYMRQTYTLPDNHSIVAKFSMGAYADTINAWAADHQRIILSVNNSSSGPIAGLGGMCLVADTDSNSSKVIFRDTANVFVYESPDQSGLSLIGSSFYFRIARSGLNYYGFYSGDGLSWVSFPGIANVSAADRIWIGFDSSTVTTPLPIGVCHWVRVGSNDYSPW